ncbi:MAG TPA: DUF3360 family protein [Pontiella sp.]
MESSDKQSYRGRHKSSREFSSRAEYLNHELSIMNPKRWGLNLPGRDFRFEIEDIVPALAGTIGKVVMVAAVAGAWASAYGLAPDFIAENTRFEMIIVGLLFAILFSGLLNPRANLAGTHGPMIALVGAIAASGGHPLALGVLVGIFGLFLSITKGGSRLITLTGEGVRGGLLIYLGITGAIKFVGKLHVWFMNPANSNSGEALGYNTSILLLLIIIVYAVLARLKMRWLSIPLCSAIALIVPLLLGSSFSWNNEPGIPHLSPTYWWGEESGWMMGWPDEPTHWLAALPFALLAVAMWPPDFLGHRVFQELNYPKKNNCLMDADDTMTICSVRQIVGSVLGGSNLTSSWGTYMIPAAIAKRPIPGGAILTGVFCIVAAIAGYPIDLASWMPVVCIALLVGVFLPLMEAGMQMIKDEKSAQSAGICIFSSMLVNPVFGWVLTMFLDNQGLIGDSERGKKLKVADRLIIPGIALFVCTFAMAGVGIIKGVPAFLVNKTPQAEYQEAVKQQKTAEKALQAAQKAFEAAKTKAEAKAKAATAKAERATQEAASYEEAKEKLNASQ